jgi:hypothetical protein
MTVRRSTFLTALSAVLAATLALASPSASAVKMDETTHDEIISRLEMGLSGMSKSEPDRPGIVLRLADLYSDRARLKAMNELDQNCAKCTGARNDRVKAIAYYNEALPRISKDKQGPVVLQIAHLSDLNGQGKKSIALYTGILRAKRSTYSSEVRAIAETNVGEIYFRKGDFKTALKHFEAARRENLKTRALVEYRVAWCQLNLGRTQKAIGTLVRLLKNPGVLATQTTDGKNVDPSFVKDVSNDLARFLARGNVKTDSIRLLRSLSPDDARKGNLYTLASECDRLGKKSSALIVWAAYVDEGGVEANEKLEVQIRVARIFYDMNKLNLAAGAFEKAMDLWKKNGCRNNDSLCTELKSRVRGMVTAWNKAQKHNPTPDLFRAYLAYTNTFPDDYEMLHWGAVVGHDLGRHKEAAVMFHRAAALVAGELSKKPGNKSLTTIFEGSLLGEIEMAEAGKDNKAREAAYNYYLQMNPSGAKAFEVRYQRAQLYAATNRPHEAFSEFHALASTPGKADHDLKVKSADLALDSLVALKDDQGLQVRSLEYARLFPERKTEYLKISRKATMNIVAANLKNEKSADRSDYKASLAALDKVDMSGADQAEQIKFYKNKIIVAQKALALDSVNDSCRHLLTVKSLSAEDHEWTLEQEVWVAELRLDFAQAYRITRDMRLPRLSKADRELRLALLAELSGRDPRKHNEAYLRLSRNIRSANLVRVSLIRNARSPWRELDRQLKSLKKTPDLLAGIALETFAKQRDYKRAEHLLKTTRIGQFPAGRTMARHLELRSFRAFDREISRHRLQAYNESAMRSTLRQRLKLIGRSEKLARNSMAKHDWTLEILTLSQLARENRRLYRDILALPIPRRLSAQDRQNYMKLLKAQSDPYLARAEKIEGELSQMWNSGNSLQNLQATYMTSSPELQKLYRDEIKDLAKNAPSGAKSRLDSLLETPYRRASRSEILNARRDLQSHPFDIAKAENLRALEARDGSPAMVAYLDERISQLKKGKDL